MVLCVLINYKVINLIKNFINHLKIRLLYERE